MDIAHDCCGYFKLHLHKEVFNILPRKKLRKNLCEIQKIYIYGSFYFYLFIVLTQSAYDTSDHCMCIFHKNMVN